MSAIRLLYFASLREQVGVAEEVVALTPAIRTLRDLIASLADAHPNAAPALRAPTTRAAVNQVLVPLDAPLADGDEVALFPPFTGG